MTAISEITRAKIIASLEVFVENLVERYRGRAVMEMGNPREFLALTDKQGGLKPFHAAIVPSEVLRISAFERGLVTSLGTSLEECAKLIALDHHRDAIRGYELRGEVSSDALAEIERQVAVFEHARASAGKRINLEGMIDSVLRANQSGSYEVRDKKTDLYILAKDGVEYFFEMKTVKPNKDQCLRVTQGILQIHALRNLPRPQVRSYLALTYNPYGNARSEYNWSYPKNYMPFNEAALIGDEFWRIVGGPTAYVELLELYQYVGRVKGKYIAEALAFSN